MVKRRDKKERQGKVECSTILQTRRRILELEAYLPSLRK